MHPALAGLLLQLVAQLWLRIDIGGDLALARRLHLYVDRASPAAYFAGLRRHLAGSAFALANLEGAVALPPAARRGPPPRFDLTFPAAATPLLAATGFSHFSLANNHAADHGPGGVAATAAALRAAGLLPLRGWWRGTLQGVPLAVLALDLTALRPADARRQPRDDGRRDPADAAVVATLAAQIRSAADRGPVLVFWHGGAEDSDAIAPALRQAADAFLAAGATAIVGCHPHRVQEGGRRAGRPCYFSLGSVLFDRHRLPDSRGLLLRLHLWAGRLLAWEEFALSNDGPDFRPCVGAEVQRRWFAAPPPAGAPD